MLGGAAIGQLYFGETLVRVAVPAAPGFGHGGSGMSDEAYQRLLKQLGALPMGLTDDDLVEALPALQALGLL